MEGKLLRKMDKTFGLLLVIFTYLFHFKKSGKNKRLLAIKLWAIGESVLTLPAIENLKKKYSVSVLASKQNYKVYEGQVDEIIIINPSSPLSLIKAITKIKQYDIAVDFEPYSNFSAFLSSFAKKSIGFTGPKQYRSLLYTEKIKYNENKHAVKIFIDLIQSLVKAKYPKKLVPLKINKTDVNHFLTKGLNIVMHPGSASSSLSRRWAPEKFAEVADYLIEKHNVNIIFIGGPKEKKLCKYIDNIMENKATITTGKTTLGQAIKIISKSDLVVCNDSGPMHIAASLQVPTVALFGPNTPKHYGPYGNKHKTLYKSKNCSPCIRPFRGEFPECKKDCMKDITIKEVINAAEKLTP